MKTTAHFKGHAIHPMLIPFPIAFLTGAMVADVVGRLANAATWWTTGAYLSAAGIVTALLAAAPGMIDYLSTVPPNSSAKKRATYHMIVNLSAVALFAIAWILRGSARDAPSVVVIVVEVAGVALMTMGGWMGGTLVNRNFIGPEHRYANAGKWQEASFDAKAGDIIVAAKVDDLKADQMKLVRVNGKRIVIARTQEGFCAFDDHCAHRGASLADGVLICGKVQCLWHGSRYDVRSGKVEAGPADTGIAVYQVEQADGEVRLTVP